MEDSLLPCNLAIYEYDFFPPHFNRIQNFHFLTNGNDITTFRMLSSTTSITTLTLWAIITVNKVYLNTNTVIMRQLMGTARTVEAEWRQVLREIVGTRTKEGESSNGRVWAAGFHHVTAHSRLARALKLMNRLFL